MTPTPVRTNLTAISIAETKRVIPPAFGKAAGPLVVSLIASPDLPLFKTILTSPSFAVETAFYALSTIAYAYGLLVACYISTKMTAEKRRNPPELEPNGLSAYLGGVSVVILADMFALITSLLILVPQAASIISSAAIHGGGAEDILLSLLDALLGNLSVVGPLGVAAYVCVIAAGLSYLTLKLSLVPVHSAVTGMIDIPSAWKRSDGQTFRMFLSGQGLGAMETVATFALLLLFAGADLISWLSDAPIVSALIDTFTSATFTFATVAVAMTSCCMTSLVYRGEHRPSRVT